MKSILQKEKKCWLCGSTLDLHRHHVFGGSANRAKSEKYGLTVYLCAPHHNMSGAGVHFDKAFDQQLKAWAQKQFEKEYSHELFMKIFKRNYRR
ncbi:hypothetical protein [Dubosiella newyorkensis]|uniref:hypothetical protein n=1 Tax=Dubosiella newyorkensis TaxID=1862672 RepID=UPI00272C8147|nr:hypothetical protein [Dubosiella newyorkensis]